MKLCYDALVCAVQDVTGTLKASDSNILRRYIPPYTVLVFLIGLIIALGTYAEGKQTTHMMIVQPVAVVAAAAVVRRVVAYMWCT